MKIFITFGSGQYGGELTDKYVILEGAGHQEARQVFVDTIGLVFCTSYDIKELENQELIYGIREVSLERVKALHDTYYPEKPEEVPCKWCGEPTTYTGTEECNNCHEIRCRIHPENLEIILKMIIACITREPTFDKSTVMGKL